MSIMIVVTRRIFDRVGQRTSYQGSSIREISEWKGREKVKKGRVISVTIKLQSFYAVLIRR